MWQKFHRERKSQTYRDNVSWNEFISHHRPPLPVTINLQMACLCVTSMITSPRRESRIDQVTQLSISFPFLSIPLPPIFQHLYSLPLPPHRVRSTSAASHNPANGYNTQGNVSDAVVMKIIARELWWMYNSAKQLPTLRPRQLTWTVSPSTGCYHQSTTTIINLKAYTHFTIPQRVVGWVDLGTALQ